MVSKNLLKVDSHKMLEFKTCGNIYVDSIFFYLSDSDTVQLKVFGFNALNIIFWVARRHIPIKNNNISKEKNNLKTNLIQ